MFNTYIYGTPLGFDFYEDVASLKEYFKGFYISSRKGRRLMVNRRDNGETLYNYLRYGLAEKEGRPNSFFGMSISMDNNEYAYDFKEIFDWFDYLFDKLVERGSIFFLNAGNIIQYKIAKFKDNAEEVQWLKNNIPNLFTKAQGVKLLEYDSTFSATSSGQIRCFNDETTATKILEAFKKCRWIALSPMFEPEEEPIEIDSSDIEAQLNKYTQQLVPIAISPKQENLNILHSIESNCVETIGLIQKYLATERDESEQRTCASLIERTREIVTNAKTIATKIDISGSTINPFPPKPHLKRCNRCGKNLPLLNFANVNSRFCIDCENQIHQSKSKTRKCTQCGKEKNQSEFPEGSSTCYDCKSHKSFLDYIDAKLIAVFLVFVLIAGISLYLIFGGDKSSKYSNEEPQTDEVLIEDENLENDSFDANKFNNFLINKEFKKAYSYIKDIDNNEIYISQLKASIEQHLWEILDSTQPVDIELSVRTFFLNNRNVVTDLNIDEQTWVNLANVYSKLYAYANHSQITESQRADALNLVNKLPNDPPYLKETWQARITAIPTTTQAVEKNTKDNQQETKKGAIEQPQIILIDPENPDGFLITENVSKSYPAGTRITIKSNINISRVSGDVNKYVNRRSKSCTIEVGEGKSQTVVIRDVTINITGTAKKSGFKTITK